MAMSFSVLLPTYAGDDAAELDTALASCFDQTRRPDELLVVEDGPLTDELDATLDEWERRYPDTLRRHALTENGGLGNALRVGVEAARHPWVARFDADDHNVRTRFETQCRYVADNPDVDVLGGYIAEFADDPENVVARREVPTTHADIERMARFRSPMNHGTVLMRRAAVLSAGNYRPVTRMEDYDLWIRMLCDGARFANVPEVLVNVRAGAELAGRRGGLEYARAEVRRQVEFYRRGFTSLPVFLCNVTARTTLRLVPDRMRRLVYARFAREQGDGVDRRQP
ncbi:glycosyltransferase [Haloarcula pellucida]|uniref:Glycosyl transferase n=1 Tax=Haloarcula pellucida TaxID=1427151 RepID=A0A830GKU8_9EURY|nr:glycosyltransferase [Halomicroarcula pellucida]MBX0348697.1 glycosyltransferase [Halomicroarcula pellucida]GGN92166.1 glycosyl transferase [Halomicroarcula pellucida]